MCRRYSSKVVRAAFRSSLPVLMGYTTMGIAAGILMASKAGIHAAPLWAFLTSATSISGTLEFMMTDWIAKRTPMTDILLLTICINLRYAMYGISLLDRFRNLHCLKKFYFIWTLTDETYALEVENKVPEGEDSITYCFLIALFDHSYWVIGVTLGALIGVALPFNTLGIDFAMTALFLVILTDQWREKANRMPAAIGAGCALLSYCFFPTGKMLLPAIFLMIGMFLSLRRFLDVKKEATK